MMNLNTSAVRAIFERLLLVVAASTASCAPDSDAAQRSKHVAAGEAAESKGPGWDSGREWRLDTQLLVEIGSETREYQFAGVPGAVRLSDGRIVVGDAGSSEIRVYDPQGRFLTAAGRSGDGPGEFRQIDKLVRGSGDSVLVFDAGSGRLSLLDPGGTFMRSVTPSTATPGASFAGVLENGSYVIGVPVPLPPREGLSRDSLVYLLVSQDGSTLDTLLVAPGGEQYQRVDGSRVLRMTNPFGPMPVASASGDRIFVGATDRYEIRQFGPNGALVRVLRREVPSQPFTDAHFRRVAERVPQMASALAELPLPSRVPAFASLLVDREGNLWVQDYPSPGGEPVAWTVFSRQGAILGQIVLPAAFRPTDVGADYVLGVGMDEQDVERIRMYALRKP